MGENGKDPKKQEPKVPSRRHMTALWIAIATALGSQGIPKIVELLENKPDVEQVQTMIAKQTEALTKAQQRMTDAVRELDGRLRDLEKACAEHRTVTGQLEGRTELLKDVMRDCCTRRSVRERLERPELVKPEPKPEPMATMDEADEVPEAFTPFVKTTKGKKKKKRKKSAVEKVQKVPDFDVQQQLQVQEPGK